MFDLTTELFGDSASVRYIDGEYDSHRELISAGIDKILLAPESIFPPIEDKVIIPTNIKLINQQDNSVSCHSIVIIKDNNDLYLFDPNGYYHKNRGNDWLYCINGIIFDSTTDFYNYFSKLLKANSLSIFTSDRRKNTQVYKLYQNI